MLTGKEVLGVEFGSTRIKAVLIDENCCPIASGNYDWENKLENGYWTYSLDDVWTGLQTAYSKLNDDAQKKFGAKITNLSGIGFSAMMHGYLPFDKNGNQLAPFRTWRNTTTAKASKVLTDLFSFNIPQRWSISHLYQAILNNEEHTKDISFLTTLAGYVHWKLTDKKVLGVGEASGMFPINSSSKNYNQDMISKFNSLIFSNNFSWKIEDILPKVLVAGDDAGVLTDAGAKLLDISGNLKSGIPLCPPEGDAGTGMVATNSIAKKTGNVSAGTSIFSMVVLDKNPSKVYEEIDMVTTPDGKPVAMVHCNNCCTEFDNWVNTFYEFAKLTNADVTKPQVYDLLYNEALKADSNCGGIVCFNYLSGEPVTHTDDGRVLVARQKGTKQNLANFVRSQIYSTMATLKIGMEILEKENVEIDRLTGHGGLFKTPIVGQRLMAGAMNVPISVMETAGEGGAWGIAILAKYASNKKGKDLSNYLDDEVFSHYKSSVIEPYQSDVDGFNEYIKLYKSALNIEKAAVDCI